MSDASLWIVALPEGDEPDPRAWAALSDEERARAARLRMVGDRAAYVHGHAAMRLLIERQLGRSLHRRPFDVTPAGKPWLAGVAIGFSYSRSRQRAAIGIVNGEDLGVDIEAIEPGGTNGEVAHAHFADSDLAWLRAAADARLRERRFCRLWVIREAVLKAEGGGLTRPLATVEIRIDGDALELADASRWRIVEAPPLADYAAAAAVPRRSSVRWLETRWSDLATS